MSASEPRPADGLRIGELARLTGLTTRAIRHYHEVGLLAEPARDASGYRRYTAADLIALVRVRRLRALGMPIEQIAGRLGPDGASHPPADGGEGLPAALTALADDLTRQIEALTELRAKVRALAASPAADAAPARIWGEALTAAGVLERSADLPAREREAVDLLDALAPDGIDPLARQAAALAAVPSARRHLGAALERFRSLAPDAPAGQTDALAAAFAAAVGEAGLRPPSGAATPAVPVEVMDKLAGDRYSLAQLRCLHRVRELLEDGE